MTPPGNRLAALLALAAAGALAAGCGSNGGETTTVTAGESTATTEDDGSQRVVIEAEDGAFDARAIYEAAAPGVVTIISIFGDSGPIVLGGGNGGGGQGSGFVVSEDGEILTNAHVVTDAATTGTPTRPLHEATEIYVQFADGNQVEGEVVGFDPFSDVALLRVDPEGLDLQPLPLGSETEIEVGDAVAAIGSPFGQAQSQSLSVGVISAADRSIESLTDFRIEGALQTDASINPGNSGGPLLNGDGEVVGINQQIQTASGGNEGVGFAVPIDLAERAAEQLRDDGEVAYAYAGVTTTPIYPQLADKLEIDADSGALVAEVVPGSPADDAGLQAGSDELQFQGIEVVAGGDVITAVNGEEIADNSDLPRIVSLMDPGDVVTLDVIRDGDTEQVEITLGERPTDVDRQP